MAMAMATQHQSSRPPFRMNSKYRGTGNECFETRLIKEDGTLNGVELNEFTRKVNLAGCGLKYAVVSIMGPQSSGKSTLLNHLFGTKFEELDGLQRCGKTTNGIWLARCADIEPCTLVMDVEGSDGQERKDDTSFERRSGVFALAVSHIVLINMFYTSVGLENAASKPLLENVLKDVLRLFSPRKTTLMFVVRDLVQMTQLDIYKPKLMEAIQKIWDSIPKPEHQKRTPLSTFFNIKVEGLPNYLEREEQFKEQVKHLRQQINLSIDWMDRQDKIPGSGFSCSAERIWGIIKEDRELDLPSNTVMIAKIRCEEIVAEMLKAFDENEERLKLETNALTNRARDFREKYSSIIKSCMDGYNEKTEYYNEDVRFEKRKDLKEKLMLFVQSALLRIVAQIGSRTLEKFKEAYQNAMNKGKDADNCKEAWMKSFDDECADVIVEQANCNTSEERKKLQLEIDNFVLQVQLKQAEKGYEFFKKLKASENTDEKLKASENTDEKLKASENTDEKLKASENKWKAIGTGIAVGVASAAVGTAVAGGAIAMATIGLPVTVIATAVTGVFLGFAAVGTLIGNAMKSSN